MPHAPVQQTLEATWAESLTYPPAPLVHLYRHPKHRLMHPASGVVQCLGSQVQGLGFRVRDLGLRVGA